MLGKSFPGTENWADGSSSVMGVRPFLGPRYIYSYVQLILGPFFIDGAIGLLGHSCITTLSHIIPYFRPPIIYSYCTYFIGPRYIYSYVQLILGPFYIDGAIGLLGHSCITTLSHIVPYFRPPIIYSYIQLKLGPFCIHGAIGLPLGISYLYYHSVTYRT